MVCIEKERAAADLHIGDLVSNHSVYCVWTGHTSVVTGCCSATCTTVQHLVKCRAKLLFSISPLNRSLSLSIHFALHSSLRRPLFIRHFTRSPVSLLSILPIKFLLTPIGHTLCSGPSRYCSYLHKLPVYLIIFQDAVWVRLSPLEYWEKAKMGTNRDIMFLWKRHYVQMMLLRCLSFSLALYFSRSLHLTVPWRLLVDSHTESERCQTIRWNAVALHKFASSH